MQWSTAEDFLALRAMLLEDEFVYDADVSDSCKGFWEDLASSNVSVHFLPRVAQEAECERLSISSVGITGTLRLSAIIFRCHRQSQTEHRGACAR